VGASKLANEGIEVTKGAEVEGVGRGCLCLPPH